mmetsp:Transcript_29738/g.100169  ORF Transcript_29738/g.100169 Transcript_29738/m.100169 type:complete len:203 (-) Transcript_29738:359-967(-)
MGGVVCEMCAQRGPGRRGRRRPLGRFHNLRLRRNGRLQAPPAAPRPAQVRRCLGRLDWGGPEAVAGRSVSRRRRQEERHEKGEFQRFETKGHARSLRRGRGALRFNRAADARGAAAAELEWRFSRRLPASHCRRLRRRVGAAARGQRARLCGRGRVRVAHRRGSFTVAVVALDRRLRQIPEPDTGQAALRLRFSLLVGPVGL